MSLLELTSAYAAVAAGAYPVEPTGLALQDAAASAVRPMDEAQVRQPMYQGSVDLWKRYGDRLKPLLDRLD